MRKILAYISLILIAILLLGAIGCDRIDNTDDPENVTAGVTTEKPTQAEVEQSTEKSTEGSTDSPANLPTEAPTHTSTEVVTQAQTEQLGTEGATSSIIEPSTESSTQIATQPVTEHVTEPASEPTSEPTSEIATENRTETPTQSPTESSTETPTEPPAQIIYGNKVGDVCYEADLISYSGESLSIADTRGKVTVINFWGTWCPYCVYELPAFDRIASEYPDIVSIIAIHSSGDDEGKDFVDENYPDTKIIFANDPTDSDAYYLRLGGVGYYPMTYILDENGVIAYIQTGAMSYDTLKAQISKIVGELPCIHSYDNSCDTTCNLCGAVRETSHIEKTVDAIPADCENQGYTQGIACGVCGVTIKAQQPIAAIGHNYVSSVEKDPACTDNGVMKYTCKNNSSHTYKEDISALGHNYENHEAQIATCTEIGWNAYQTCTRCDYNSYDEISALGHNYENHEAQSATCTETGWNAYQTCTRCDYNSYNEISALGHNYENHEAQSATCTEIGWNAYQTCTRCDYNSYDEIPALGHAYTADCDTVCNVCRYIREVAVFHEYDNKCDADCNICGETRDAGHSETVEYVDRSAHTITCSVCGRTTAEKHAYVGGECSSCGATLAETLDMLDFTVDVEAGRDVVVLQLSDTQIIDSSQARSEGRLDDTSDILYAPSQTTTLCYAYIATAIRKANPDFIFIAGDVIYGEFDDNGSQLQALVDLMDGFKIPWAAVYGNHDNESMMTPTWQNEVLASSKYGMFKKGDTDGNGNYTVGIIQGGALTRVFYMMDSNGCKNFKLNASEYNVIKTQGFTQAQVDWLQARMVSLDDALGGKSVGASMVYHIPSMEFYYANQRYLEKASTFTINDQVKGYNGDIGTYQSNLSSAFVAPAASDGTAYLDILKQYHVDSVFSGHYHSTNTSVLWEGIRWTMGLKTGQYVDYGTYKGHQLLGGTQISFSDNGVSVSHLYHTTRLQNTMDKLTFSGVEVFGMQYGTDNTSQIYQSGSNITVTPTANVSGYDAYKIEVSSSVSYDRLYIPTTLTQGKSKFSFSVYIESEADVQKMISGYGIFAVRVKDGGAEPEGYDGNDGSQIGYNINSSYELTNVKIGEWNNFEIDISAWAVGCTEFSIKIPGGNTIYIKDVALT